VEAVEILYHHEQEGWWAESEALPGWTAVGGSLDDVREQAKSAVRTFLGGDTIIEEKGLPAGRDLPSAAG
jgi:predicted RNase H-like HicB family nuclease